MQLKKAEKHFCLHFASFLCQIVVSIMYIFSNSKTTIEKSDKFDQLTLIVQVQFSTAYLS